MNLGAPSVVRCFKEESAVTMNLFGSIELILFVAIARNNMANMYKRLYTSDEVSI